MAKKFRIVGRGYDVSLVTATSEDVLKDKVIIGPEGELITGTMEIDGTATADKLLLGETAWVNGEKITGTIPVYKSTDEGESLNLMPGDTYSVPSGYYEEDALTIVNQKFEFENGTATASDVLQGKTIYIDGEEIEGTIPVDNSTSIGPFLAGDHVILTSAYYTNDIYMSVLDLKSQTEGTATAANILKGKTAWVNGICLAGSMPNRGAVTSSLNAGKTYTIPVGYHNGSGVITANTLADQTPGDATAGSILKGYNAYVNGEPVEGTAEYISSGRIQYLGKSGVVSTISAKYRSSTSTDTGLTVYNDIFKLPGTIDGFKVDAIIADFRWRLDASHAWSVLGTYHARRDESLKYTFIAFTSNTVHSIGSTIFVDVKIQYSSSSDEYSINLVPYHLNDGNKDFVRDFLIATPYYATFLCGKKK